MAFSILLTFPSEMSIFVARKESSRVDGPIRGKDVNASGVAWIGTTECLGVIGCMKRTALFALSLVVVREVAVVLDAHDA